MTLANLRTALERYKSYDTRYINQVIDAINAELNTVNANSVAIKTRIQSIVSTINT